MSGYKKYIFPIVFMILIMCGCNRGSDKTPSVSLDSVSGVSSSSIDSQYSEYTDIQYVNDIVSFYVYDDEDGINNLLSSFSVANSRLCNKWIDIIEDWNLVNSDDYVMYGMLPDGLPQDETFCIVVLGYQLNADGSMKDELIGRLEVALENAQKYPECYVLVTGGGTALKNSDATEADMMSEWLIDNGMDEDRIIIENNSKTTVENAYFSCSILKNEYPEVSSVAIITSDYHISLGSILFMEELRLTEDENFCAHVEANAAYAVDMNKEFSVVSQGTNIKLLFALYASEGK